MESKLKVEDHIGIIVTCVKRYYVSLPETVMYTYDIEDMVSEVVIKVLKHVNDYKPEIAKPSTWIYRIAENICRDLLLYYGREKRHAPVTSLDHLYGESKVQYADPNSIMPDVGVEFLNESMWDSEAEPVLVESLYESIPDPSVGIEYRLTEARSALERFLAVISDSSADLVDRVFFQHQGTADDVEALMGLKKIMVQNKINFDDLDLALKYLIA